MDPSGHYILMEELERIYNAVEEKKPFNPNEGSVALAKLSVEKTKERNKYVKFADALRETGEYDENENKDIVEYVLGYDYLGNKEKNMNYVDYVIGQAVFNRTYDECHYYNKGNGKIVWTVDKWLDLYDAPTMEGGNSRFVRIPDDRPRIREEFLERYGANTAPSWKSYEPGSENLNEYGEVKHLNNFAYDLAISKGLKPEVGNMGMIVTTDDNGIKRYWVAVGPRVADPYYSVIGKEPTAEDMKVGTFLDVILRDSYYNVYFVPAIIGDGKKHTLGEKYVDDGTIENGVYQTGYSWETGKEEEAKKADGAVIEFIRESPVQDTKLMGTPEFDILGIIFYNN